MAGYVIHLIIADEYLRKTDEVIKNKEDDSIIQLVLPVRTYQ